MGNGWEQLHCLYFHDTCLRAFEDYFHAEGFTRHHADVIGGVIFEGVDCYVEISYEAETYPQYSPTLVIGLGASASHEGLSVTGVPFWFLIPPTNEASKYTFWKFDTQAKLFTVLEQIKNDIMQPIGRPLWKNVKDLKRAIHRFKVEHVGGL